MGNGAVSLFCYRATLYDEICSQITGGGAHGSDSGLGKRDCDRDCGGGCGAVMGVAIVVEAI